jgi:glycosyltransferase involved in cell wall biosynthesis
VLFLGQKRPYKGIAELVAAAELVWRRHPDAAFVFAGPPTPFSRALFAKTRDRRIVELGNVDLAEKTALIERCDVMCLPSTQESFGLVIVEAWAKRKPVVACDIPALRSVVDDGVNGVLCQQTPASIAAALDSLLASAEKREAMGRAGLAKQQERYTWERLAAALLRIYESL